MNRMIFLAAALAAGAAGAEEAHDGHGMQHGAGMRHDMTMQHDMNHGDHAAHMTGGHGMASTHGMTPTEPGQGAFGAIGEIVALLSADPDTDWSRVNIDALRAHLVDMDMLVTYAEVETTPLEGGAEFSVALTGPAAGAARRMIPAHAPVLAAETGWESEARVEGDRAFWRVTGEGVKIRALGFFGLMALGDHHRPHHLAMASGRPMH